jgi:hypothetical protein
VIWFTCKKCSKVHGRPENSIGSMIFCDCGQGLTVPWESTVPEPAQAPVVMTGGAAERTEPLTFGEPSRPTPLEPLPPPRTARGRARFSHDPNFCFNHDTRAKQKTCEECGLPFCDSCVVTFRGQTLCGPCKNYAAKLLQRPPQTSGFATLSFLSALALGPLAFCLFPAVTRPGVSWVLLLAVIPQALAFAAGFLALHKSKKDPRVGGQTLAITGMLTASFTTVLTIALTVAAGHLGT